MDRINMINSQDHKVPGAIQWGLDTVIDDEDVVLLVSIVYIYFGIILLEFNGCKMYKISSHK